MVGKLQIQINRHPRAILYIIFFFKIILSRKSSHFLLRLLFAISGRNDCYALPYSISTSKRRHKKPNRRRMRDIYSQGNVGMISSVLFSLKIK